MSDRTGSMSRTLVLLVSYDGSDFHGFARQPGLRTVEGVLRDVLSQVLGDPDFRISVAGRTDAGVHAVGQVVSVTTSSVVPLRSLQRSLDKMLPDDLRAVVAEADPEFDARFDALARRYRYRLHIGPSPDPLRRNRVWWVGPLEAMQKRSLFSAAAVFLGTHDFSAFCKASLGSERKVAQASEKSRAEGPRGRDRTVKTVHEAIWREPRSQCDCCKDELWFEVEAEGFCHQMVRRMVSTMLHWARKGERPLTPEELSTVPVGPAPAYGLYLLTVRYRSLPHPLGD